MCMNVCIMCVVGYFIFHVHECVHHVCAGIFRDILFLCIWMCAGICACMCIPCVRRLFYFYVHEYVHGCVHVCMQASSEVKVSIRPPRPGVLAVSHHLGNGNWTLDIHKISRHSTWAVSPGPKHKCLGGRFTTRSLWETVAVRFPLWAHALPSYMF